MILQYLHAFWNDLWPNVVAPSLWTLLAVIVSHLKRTRQAERHHQEMKEHVTAPSALAARMAPPAS